MIRSAGEQAVMRAHTRERNRERARKRRAHPEVRKAEMEANKQPRPQLSLCVACLPSSFACFTFSFSKGTNHFLCMTPYIAPKNVLPAKHSYVVVKPTLEELGIQGDHDLVNRASVGASWFCIT